ncbi:RNA polymerase sigma factor [Corallococcus sp. CA054B]|nr:RNA polymerase sigma factor [Corallococcus sp. CA054B]
MHSGRWRRKSPGGIGFPDTLGNPGKECHVRIGRLCHHGPARKRSSGGTSMADKEMQTFAALVIQFRSGLLKHAQRILGNTADAEDLVQHALDEAWKERLHLQGPEAFRAWTGRVINTRAISLLRHHRAEQRKAVNAGWVTVLADDPEESEGGELWTFIQEKDLREAVERLPPQQREVFHLRAQGRSYVSIGAQVGRSTGTVGWWLHQVREQLRERLQPIAEERRLSVGTWH